MWRVTISTSFRHASYGRRREVDGVSMNDQSWLYEWIDEYELYSPQAISDRVKSPSVVARLYELAEQASVNRKLVRSDSWTDLTLVAGQGFNISCETSCGGYPCQIAEVDALIANSWHYFDKVVLAGPSPGELKANIENTPERRQRHLFHDLKQDVLTLLYLRDIGATDRVAFRPSDLLHDYDCTAKNVARMGFDVVSDKKTRNRVITQIERKPRSLRNFLMASGRYTSTTPS